LMNGAACTNFKVFNDPVTFGQQKATGQSLAQKPFTLQNSTNVFRGHNPAPLKRQNNVVPPLANPANQPNQLQWYYIDKQGNPQGPWPSYMMEQWRLKGFLPSGTQMRKGGSGPFKPLTWPATTPSTTPSLFDAIAMWPIPSVPMAVPMATPIVSQQPTQPTTQGPMLWFYKDVEGMVQGPFTNDRMADWSRAEMIPMSTMVAQGRSASTITTWMPWERHCPAHWKPRPSDPSTPGGTPPPPPPPTTAAQRARPAPPPLQPLPPCPTQVKGPTQALAPPAPRPLAVYDDVESNEEEFDAPATPPGGLRSIVVVPKKYREQKLPEEQRIERKTKMESCERDLSELEEQLQRMSLESSQEPGESLEPERDEQSEEQPSLLLSLQEYLDAVETGEIKPYTGKTHSSAEERYADGWKINRETKRWVNTASKAAMAAKMEEDQKQLKQQLESMKQRSEFERQQGILKDKVRAKQEELDMLRRDAEAKAPLDGQTFLVLDTNCFMDIAREHDVRQKITVAAQRISRLPQATLLIPNEVLNELDRHKASKVNPDKAFMAREGVRFIESLQDQDRRLRQTDGRGEDPPSVRGQQDSEVYKDDAHHKFPERLRGDDSILNCCLCMLSKGAEVVLCSKDSLLRQRGEANNLRCCTLDKLQKEINDMEKANSQ